MTKKQQWRPIPEQQSPVAASKDRIQSAIEFFETHFDLDGYPISKHGLLLHHRYSKVVYIPIEIFRVFEESHREEPETCGADNPEGSRTVLTVEYVPPHGRGEGRDEGSL